jgi:uncharacterized protein
VKRSLSMAALAVALIAAAPAEPAKTTDTKAAHKGGIAWQTWTDDLFERARAEKRYVILDLEAVWCHWCHVMEEETYSDPEVQRAIREHYIPVRVDQDSRPDLSIRYEQYGWPATVIFGPDGTEIVKRRGFIPARVLASILVEVVKDPSPVKGIQVVLPDEYAKHAQLSEAERKTLRERQAAGFDREKGGLEGPYRYLPWEALEYAFVGSESDALDPWIQKTLLESMRLVDPVWGGVYQYSVEQRWDKPHYEKIMSFQAEGVRIYALAYAHTGDPRYLETAKRIANYVDEFLMSPEGAFYTSQDADVVPGEPSDAYYASSREERLKKGVPRVDKHRYARENGWMIEALATLYEVSGERTFYERAQRAAVWVIANRAGEAGSFRHDEKDVAGPYLGDTLAMGRAFLQLYRVSAERQWLERADAAAAFIEKNFRRADAGYLSARGDKTPIEPLPQLEENVSLARFANLLQHYTGKEALRATAEHAFRYAATTEIHELRRDVGLLLLADRELSEPPTHLTVVGAKADLAAEALFQAGLRHPEWYKRVEWWDPKEGKLPNADIEYPTLPKPAAFFCAKGACSSPIYDPPGIAKFWERRQAADAAPASGTPVAGSSAPR